MGGSRLKTKAKTKAKTKTKADPFPVNDTGTQTMRTPSAKSADGFGMTA
jgi:hypothetical protein